MHKRQFLVAGTLGAVLPSQARAASLTVRSGPGLLTVAGAIAHALGDINGPTDLSR
jgi:hypothetical protein